MLNVGNAPVSWAVFTAAAETNPSWTTVLDEIAGAGYRWLELGPIGFLPEDADRLRRELGDRGLGVIGTFLYEELQDPTANERILAATHRICGLLQAVDARFLVIIQAMTRDRALTAGRSADAERLDEAQFATLVQTVGQAASIAREGYGLTAVFHPHAGTYVEFQDEINRLLAETDPLTVELCIDTGHSAYAGVDPVELLGRNRRRTAYLHLKDVSGPTLAEVVAGKLDFDRGVAAGVFCPLGEGVVDFPGLRAALQQDANVEWATVEQDVDPQRPVDPKSAAEASLTYLQSIGLARNRE